LGTLEKVTYPTGGHTKFFYESHVVSAQESPETALEKSYYLLANELGGHVKIFELNEKTGITINAAIKCPTLSCYPGGSNTPCDFTNAMLNDFYVTITDLQTGARVYSAPYSDYECKFYPNTTCSQNVQASLCGITKNEDVTLEAGRYKLETHPLFGFQAEANVAYKLKLNTNPQINTIHYKGGGLRISKIIDHDGLSSANDIVRRFDYTTKLASGATVSSGRLMTIPKYHSLEINTIAVEGNTAECAVIKSASYSNVPMGNSAQGSPIGYDKVTIHYGDNDENGYSVFTYKNDPDIETEPYLPNSPTTNHTVSNGLPLMEYHYTRDGFKVKEVENLYSSFPTEDSVAAVYVFSTNSCGGSVNGAMAYKEYSEHSAWWFLDTKTERTFDRTDASNARFLEVVSSYEYGPVHKMVVKEQTVSSEGQTIESNYYYPLDLQESANAEMWDESSPDYKHIHATPLKQETLQVSPATQFVGGIKYNYQYDGAKDLVFLASVEKALNTGVYEMRMTVDQVDDMGNILQVRTSENVPVSYLWGYDQTLPVTQVNNASWDQIYYEGFETSATMTDPTLAHSGNQYQASTFLIPFNPPAGQYELSYWKYDNGSWVNVKEPYTASTTITGERLDDIRVYPKGAQMTTYDYDPLVGTITSSDVNNKPTHYKYDELQRLYLILDQDKQAVKGFNYQYKN
jgi:hypothetical protein